MSNLKITQLTSLTGANVDLSNDVLPIIDVNDTTMSASGTNKKISAGELYASFDVKAEMMIVCSDETTALEDGNAIITFRMPYDMTLTSVRASLTTAQASGNIFTVDINESGVSILSTKLTIDNTETTSVTAATPPVISDTALADNSVITIDIDQIGDGTAKGLKIYLIGYRA